IYSLVRDRDPIANEFFTLDENGTLRTAEVLDYEKNASLFIRARVTDKGGLLTKNGFVIEVINVVEDNDKDGVEDHYDLDDDNDGFSDSEELAYGSDPLDPNSVANAAPNSLYLNGTTILENQSAGTIIGRLIGHDPDTNATLIYSQIHDGNQSQSPVYVGPAGVVRSTRVFDYETNEHNYTLVAKVSDEHNFSIEQSFTIYLLNQIEDIDGDGVEDHLDEDIDGDGFSNDEEIAYGSNPRDAHSVINAPPTDITMQGGEVLENQPLATLVGRFFGVDADKNDSLTYQLVDPVIGENFPFKLSQRGGLRTTRKLDYESDENNYSLTVRVLDDRNESFEKSFTVHLINVVEDLDGDSIEDAYDEDIDGDGYSNEQEQEIGTNPADQYSRPEKPILRRGQAIIDENGSIHLTGGILANGRAEITDFGFVLSSGVSLDRRKSTVYWVRGHGEPQLFKLTVTESPFQEILYFRTWAKNAAGYGIGPVRKVVIPDAPQPWWGEVAEGAGGWLSSDWFGTFKYYEQGWLYHARLGWLYSSPVSENSVWLWKEDRGWLWTKPSLWPYFWWDSTQNWLYLNPSKPGEPIRFYDYSTESYR
ncbi:MAG: cadherin domain-containing protein, partial [Opitutae bacterium]